MVADRALCQQGAQRKHIALAQHGKRLAAVDVFCQYLAVHHDEQLAGWSGLWAGQAAAARKMLSACMTGQ
jgi:hypothetical protein